MGRKRVTTEQDLLLIHRLVLNGLKIRAACRQVARRQGWPSWKVNQFEETARKAYAERRKAGTLPSEEPPDPRHETAILAEYREAETLEKEARRALEEAQAQAALMSLDLEALEAGDLEELKREGRALANLLAGPSGMARQFKREEPTKEAALERLHRTRERLGVVEELVALIEKYQWAKKALAHLAE